MIARPDGFFRLVALTAALLAGGMAATARADAIYAPVLAKSSLTYSFTQAGATNQGSFRAFSVSFDPVGGKLSVVIDMRSFDTGDTQRNGILGGSDMFDVAAYPQARFTATRIEKSPTGFVAVGSLTIRGITRPASAAFAWRTVPDSRGEIGYLPGQIVLRRLDFGIGQGEWRSTEWVGNEVTVHYSLELEAK